MKRQRNTQQVKEQESCPPNQTKEEEIGNLSEKEFQILIVKMIQNLEIKMESQINSLETRIENMQERFNKDLEEIKKSQYIIILRQLKIIPKLLMSHNPLRVTPLYSREKKPSSTHQNSNTSLPNQETLTSH